MSRISPPRPDDEERALRIAVLRQELRDLLWRQVAIADADVPIALSIPPSVWHALKSAGLAPPRFRIGRRVFTLGSDLRRWLEQQPKITTTTDSYDDAGENARDERPSPPDYCHPSLSSS